MNKDIEELIVRDLFDVWKEAKQEFGNEWDDVTFESLPEKHKHEYYLTAQRIMGYHKHEPNGELREKIRIIIITVYGLAKSYSEQHNIGVDPTFDEWAIADQIQAQFHHEPAPVLSDKEVQLLGQEYEESDHSMTLNNFILTAQVKSCHKYYTGKSIGGRK